MHRNPQVQCVRARDDNRKGDRRRNRVPAGHKRINVNLTAEVKQSLERIAGIADSPRNLTAQILVSLVAGNLQHFTSFPHPHVEKCVKLIEVPLPIETAERWRKLAAKQGLLGLSSFICWAIDAISNAAPAEDLAKLVRSRPDLRKVIQWAKSTTAS